MHQFAIHHNSMIHNLERQIIQVENKMTELINNEYTPAKIDV